MSLFGLILGGGKSQRMGQDKAHIQIDGRSMAEIQYVRLGPHVQKTFFSGPEIDDPFILNIPDLIPGLGPLGGIYSALKHYSVQSFLVLPVDVLLDGTEVLKRLVSERDPNLNGTVLYNENLGHVEPLMAIYEPSCLEKLEEYVKSGDLGAQDFVEKAGFKLVPMKPGWRNINTPEDLESILPPQG